MKILKLKIPCHYCKKPIAVSVPEKGLKEWESGKHVQDAFPKLSPELREMFISQTCPKCWDEMFGIEEEGNPANKDFLFDDAVRIAEYRFKKPYRKFSADEIKYLHRLYGKADDDRISLKVYPATSAATDDATDDYTDDILLPSGADTKEIVMNDFVAANPKKRKKNPKKPGLGIDRYVKTKADEMKKRRAVRSTQRKFKMKEKDFGPRQWAYATATLIRIKNI